MNKDTHSIHLSTTGLTLDMKPIITVKTHLRIGSNTIPVKTEIDLSNVHPASHERAIRIIDSVYNTDHVVNF